MKNIKNIRNGSLYFNEKTRKVERVLGSINSQRVWTKYHKNDTKDVQIKNLRLANENEVQDYIGESKFEQIRSMLPPLPMPNPS